MLFLAVPIIFGLFSDFGVSTIASTPLPFALYLAVSLLILLPEATALWVSVVGLLTIADARPAARSRHRFQKTAAWACEASASC